jgi:adenylosuccinate lyase
VERGLSRDAAYRVVQELAQRAWHEGVHLRDLLAADERVAPLDLDLDELFDYGHYVRHAAAIVARLDALVSGPA